MPKGSVRSFNRIPAAQRPIVKKSFALNHSFDNIDGATGVGFDSVVIEGLPEGNIMLLGAVLNATLTKTTANIVDAFDGDLSVGTTPVDDGTMSGADIDIIPQTAITQATSGVSASNRCVSTNSQSGDVFDNTASTLEINVNLLIDDADTDGDDQNVDMTGTLDIAYLVLGDD